MRQEASRGNTAGAMSSPRDHAESDDGDAKKTVVHEIYRAVLPLTPNWWKNLPTAGPFHSTGFSSPRRRETPDDPSDERQTPSSEDRDEELSDTDSDIPDESSALSETFSSKLLSDDIDYSADEENDFVPEFLPGGPSPMKRSYTSLSFLSGKSSKKVGLNSKISTSGSCRVKPEDLETVLDLSERPPEYDKTGERAYFKACRKYGAPISAKYGQKLREEEALDMSNYGLGPHGIKAAAIPLMINTNCTSLNLKGNAMNHKALTYLTIILEENTSIRSLNLSGTDIGRFGAKLVAELIGTNDVLRKLDISANGFGDEDGCLLASALEDNRNLMEVNISENNLGSRSCEALRSMIAENSNLEYIDLSWNHIRGRGAGAVARGIKDNIGLKRINLAWNGFEDQGAIAIADALKTNSTLNDLNLTCNRITGKGFNEIIKALIGNETLTILLLGRNHINETSAVEAMSRIADTPEWTLEHLDLAEILFSKSFNEVFDQVKAVHSDFRCTWGYTDSYGKRKLQTYDAVDEAFQFMQAYITEHNINLAELFAKFDADGSMSVTYDEFKEGLRDAGIPMTPLQVDQLIKFLDQDGDGEIDFSELVIGAETHEKQKQVAKDITEKLQSQNTPNA